MPFPKVCKCCSGEFIAVKQRTKYCSVPCKNEGIRIRPKIEGWSKYKVAYHMSDGVSRFKDIRQRIDLLIALGGRCVQCGYGGDFRGLVLDHKMSGGAEDRKRLGAKIARYYIKHLDEAKEKLQVLCATCNQIKSISNHEHNKSRRLLGTT
jgi:hypothetical protein